MSIEKAVLMKKSGALRKPAFSVKVLKVMAAGLMITFCLTGFRATAQEPAGSRKGTRYLAGFSYTKQKYRAVDAYDENDWIAVPGLKGGYEQFGLQQKLFPTMDHPNVGLGFALTNLLGFSWTYDNLTASYDDYTGFKHYVSSYLFREFDIRNIITLGLSGGPGLNVTWVTASDTNSANPGMAAMSMGAGIHTAQYAQKYIGKKKAVFIRYGWDQFFMIGSGFTGSGTFAVGF